MLVADWNETLSKFKFNMSALAKKSSFIDSRCCLILVLGLLMRYFSVKEKKYIYSISKEANGSHANNEARDFTTV